MQFAPASGTYGHSCYDDVAQAAAIMSQLAGAPVRVQFMRSDEHGWDTYGPAHVGKVTVSAGADGKIAGYQYDGWQHDWSTTEVSDQLAHGRGAGRMGGVPLRSGGARHLRRAVRHRPTCKLVNHRVPGGGWLRGAWLRSPLDLSLRLRLRAGDRPAGLPAGPAIPVEFRKANIADKRWLGVLDAVQPGVRLDTRARPASRPRTARSSAAAASGSAPTCSPGAPRWPRSRSTGPRGRVRILHLTGAIDAGLVVNPGIVEAQITGQLVQLAGRMLSEEVTFDEHGVTSLDWSSYRVLRFDDCPQITPVVVQRLHEPSMGAGEECMAAGARPWPTPSSTPPACA